MVELKALGAEVGAQLKARGDAKARRDFATSDAIR